MSNFVNNTTNSSNNNEIEDKPAISFNTISVNNVGQKHSLNKKLNI